MKKWVAVCLCIVTLFAAGEWINAAMKRSARVDRAEIGIDASETYSEREIRAAMKVVERRFKWNYRSTLLALTYNDEKSAAAAEEWAARYGAEEAIVLYSDFVTDDDERMYGTGLEPGYTYRGWEWVLVRSHGGRWRLKTWGYG